MNQQIAFLGLGVMGSAMAANLVKRGFAVKGWNRTKNRPSIATFLDAGGIIAPSLQVAVQDADVIWLCLGDVLDVKEVILGHEGVAECAKPRALIVDSSTIGSDAAKQIGRALSDRSLRFLDAPVSGGDVGAKNATLTFMVGGDPQDFAECQPLFAAMGKTIRLCGAVGSGQGVKLCNQTLASIYMVALCEAMQLAEQMEIDPNLVIEVCGSGAAASWALTNLGSKVSQSDFEPGFTIKNMLKDLRLVKEVRATQGKDLPGVELANQLFQQVSELDGGSEQGTQAMIRAYKENP
ncbi:NAD(P)-dependent oxidoreductase [Tumidithrix elongata RA019]|uniref:NAD(P)-dependent oxidoreductase n=1 Tax=Tumidithrix elongata BACA0141 TaxID=2716417 RepID=A0AAW9PTF9_9CYAN|nr:NAD(P)-dependent oxidoreductase [Tumidithrix elongata RA019]